MTVKVIFKTSRSFVIEWEDFGIYHTDKEYEIWLNGTFLMRSQKAVQSVYGLKPDTEYHAEFKVQEEVLGELDVRTEYEFVTLNVRQFGAKGDGIHDDTLAIQTAICACPKNGRVWIPEGNYRVTSLFLKSDLTLDIGKGALLKGEIDRSRLGILPGMLQSWDETQEYNLGSWEGNPLDIFTSLFTGIGVSNVVITGEGILDGNASFEDWWEDDRAKIGAFRPRMIFLNHCSHIVLHGITVQNSPSWNIHPYFSNQLRFLDLTILNPWDSPNTDGIDPESVRDLEIAGVYFSLGDDCIAVKSGKYYMGHTYKTPSEYIEVRQCCMNNGHGAVTIGSEMAAGVYHLKVKNCLFLHTDRGLRIKTRRGRGKDAVVEDILFENIRMDHVRTPLVLNSFYNCCDPDRHSEYVRCKRPLPVDDRTPSVRQMVFRNIEAKNCHAAGAFIYGLPEMKVDYVELDHVFIDYAEEPQAEEPAMMDGIEPVTKVGVFISNVQKLVLKQVKVAGCEGEPFLLEHIEELYEEDGDGKNDDCGDSF